VSRDNKLRIREALRKEINDLALPLGVEVKVNLVHEANGWLREGIVALRVALEKTASQIHHPCDHRAVAEAELVDRDPAVVSMEFSPRSGIVALLLSEAEIVHIRQNTFFRISQYLLYLFPALFCSTLPAFSGVIELL